MGRFLRGLAFALIVELSVVFFLLSYFVVFDGSGSWFISLLILVIAAFPILLFLLLWQRYAAPPARARLDSESPINRLKRSVEETIWIPFAAPALLGCWLLAGFFLAFTVAPSISLEGLVVAVLSFGAVPIAAALGWALVRSEQPRRDSP